MRVGLVYEKKTVQEIMMVLVAVRDEERYSTELPFCLCKMK